MTGPSQSELPLIRTKVAPPRIGGTPIARSALLNQLDAQRDRKLSLLLGPAGCGKTTLLTQWRKRLCLQGATVAWFNASADDDDVYIAAYIVESFRQAGLAIGAEGFRLFARSGGKAWKLLLTGLINDLDDHQGDVYLVIDDFQYVASFAVLRLIDLWLALAPGCFHLVIASRIRPPLALGRLRAELQLSEFDFEDLRFTLNETRLFADAQGLDSLSPVQIGTLQEITDGWAAGLQLLAFSLRKQKIPGTFLEGQSKLSLSQEEALEEYLQKATVEHLQPEELAFLIRVSACRRFNRELCELLTGNPRAADFLSKFEAENLFLMSIDTTDVEPWYRLHRLFANFLNKRLEKLDEAEITKLHQLASHWFAGKGLYREALRHAKKARDTSLLVELIDRAARRMIAGAEFTQLLQWCASVPRDRLRTRLDACLCAAWVQVSFGRMDEFERMLSDIALHPECGKPEVRTEVDLMKAYRCMRQDDTAAQLNIVEPMMHSPPGSGFQLLLMCYITGIGLVYANRFEAARDVIRWLYRHERPGQHSHPKPLLEMIQGFSHLVQGHIKLAAELLISVVESALSVAALSADATGIIIGYLIEAHYQLNDLESARRLLDQNSELIDAVGAADSVLYSYRVRARIELLDGDIPAAVRTLLRLEEFGHREGLDRLVAWSLHDQIVIAIRTHEHVSLHELVARLERCADRYRLRHDCVWSEISLASLLARAEVAFAETGDASCVPFIDAADEASAANGRQLLSTRLGFMRAIALLRENNADSLPQAIRLTRVACDLGMKRVLLDFGASARNLMAALGPAQMEARERAYLDGIAALIDAPAAAPVPASVARRAETPDSQVLSSREREVLELLSKALSTKSIARALDLSSGTVKWHLKNIYAKLDALSREDALNKARALKILA